jgi:hypothetical protein
MIVYLSEECKLAESGKSVDANTSEEVEDATLKKEERKKKTRLRRRGPYRKAHAGW